MDQHYVPEFFIKQWAAADDGRVDIYNLQSPGNPWSRRAPAYTGFEKDLYSLTQPIVAGMAKHAVEEIVLKHIDNSGAAVRAKLDNHGLKALTCQDRIDWTRFIMSLRIRQPTIVRMLRNDSANHLRKTLEEQPEMYESQSGGNGPASLTDWVEKTYPGLIENFGLSFFHDLVYNPDVANKLMYMKWWLWDFAESHSLLLADHPCIFTGGIDDEKLVVALPISPSKAFFATRSESVALLMRRQTARALSGKLNESSVLQAASRIYAVNRLCERFIVNRIPRRPTN